MRKPILLGGVGISLGLWFWQSWQESLMEMGELTMMGAMALGAGFWLWQQKKPFSSLPQVFLPLDREKVEKAITTAKETIDYLASEAENFDVGELRTNLNQLPKLMTREDLQVAITGQKKVGKTSLLEILKTREEEEYISWQELEANQEVPNTADLVLYLTEGDLTESELQTLGKLRGSHHNIFILLNKQDCYLPEEKVAILQQLKTTTKAILPQENILAISATPSKLKVRKHGEDGSIEEWWEPQQPEIAALNQRLSQVLIQGKEQLVWAATWRQAVALQKQAQEILNSLRRDRALPIIEKYQWVAAATALANPVPALDLLATAAINAQLVVDLGSIYQQKLSLAQGKNTAGTLGKLMVKLGLVELSTQTIGSILKSNTFTYVAGGAVQGVSAAYLTRLAGLSLIAYFQEQNLNESVNEGFNLNKLGEKLQIVFQNNQRQAFLQDFVKQGIVHLKGKFNQEDRVTV